MLYRKFGSTGEKVSILGFGCMRFPVLEGDYSRIDEKKATEMVRYAIDSGMNYIDTAYPYHRGQSEPFIGRALADGYREKVYLATKLPSWLITSREDMDRYLDEQLERLRTDHIDFYLVHGLNRDFWNSLTGFGLFDFLDSALKSGKIRYAGFSFHDEPVLFREIVDAYPWAFCQIQFNYLDENYQAGKEGLRYAVAKGLAVVVMEPLRGGSLASSVPAEVQHIWASARVRRSPVEWGLRYLWDYPEISVVLSGMSELGQVMENIRAAEKGYPNSLTGREKELIGRVKEVYKARLKVNCTGCRYCMPCPAGVNIPQNFKHLNNAFLFANPELARNAYASLVKPERRPSNCTGCGQCEEKCPQHIPIREMLREVIGLFGE